MILLEVFVYVKITLLDRLSRSLINTADQIRRRIQSLYTVQQLDCHACHRISRQFLRILVLKAVLGGLYLDYFYDWFCVID